MGFASSFHVAGPRLSVPDLFLNSTCKYPLETTSPVRDLGVLPLANGSCLSLPVETISFTCAL